MTGIEIAILAVAVAGAATQAYGQYQEGRTAQRQAKAQAAWHAYNAKVALREREAEREATKFEVRQQEKKTKRLQARQRSLIGVSGVTMEGSPLLVVEDTAVQLALENINIRTRGQRRAQAFESQSILDISKASAAKTAAAGYGRAAYIGAGASILSGTAQAGYMGYKMGVWGTKPKGTT